MTLRAIEVAKSQPWLITEDWLRTILEISSRENTITPEVIDKIEARREMLAARKAGKIDNTRYTTKRGDTAVIDINGPIIRYADFFTEISGGTATGHVALDFQAALDDPSVKSIVLNIDSPGGEATGIHELGERIFAARGQKRVVAYVEGFGASAAYWLASAAEEIVVDKTAMLGSIGVAFVVPDPEKRSAKEVEIISTQSPKKRLSVATEAGRSELQRMADELAAVFVSTVARNRAVSEETVLNEFGQGGIRVGEDAVKFKMADRLGSFEALVNELGRTQVAATHAKKETRMYTKELKESLGLPETSTDEDVKAHLSDLKAKAGRTETAEKDAKRVAAEGLVAEWEREGKISGNATAAVKSFYVALATGEPVTPEAFAGVIAALPKIDAPRQAADAKREPEVSAVTKEDFAKAATDRTAQARIYAEVTRRKATDPKFNAKKLEAEIFSAAN